MNDELAQQITDLVNQLLEAKGFSAFATPFHGHTTTDAGQLDASKALINSPQPKIVAINNSVLSTGGAAVLSASDSAVIANTRSRVTAIEAALTTIGLLKNK